MDSVVGAGKLQPTVLLTILAWLYEGAELTPPGQ